MAINLTKDIVDALKTYTNDVQEDNRKEEDRISKEGAKKLKSASPQRYGRYGKGWKSTRTKEGRVVHNAGRSGSLTHLLEHGHAKVGGGRVAGIPHIAPVEESMIDEFEKSVERIVKE